MGQLKPRYMSPSCPYRARLSTRALALWSAKMTQKRSAQHAAQPDLEDLQADPRQHTSSKNVRDATGTKPAHTEAAEQPLNRYSKTITQSKSQGGSQAMLYATGMTEGDMDKPQVKAAATLSALSDMHAYRAAVCCHHRLQRQALHAGGHLFRMVGRQPMQHASARPGTGSQGGLPRSWSSRPAFQHHRHQ